MINRFFTTQFTVKRQIWSGDSSASVTQGTFYGNIQQSTDENLQQSLGLRFTKMFTIWCDIDTDIKEGDRLENGTDYYDVQFATRRNMGANKHLKVTVEKLDA